jgi:hypothetical protein
MNTYDILYYKSENDMKDPDEKIKFYNTGKIISDKISASTINEAERNFSALFPGIIIVSIQDEKLWFEY